MEGLVPLYEEWEVLIKHNYTREQWLSLDEKERAMHIAFSRLNHLVEGHTQDAIDTHLRRMRRRQRS